MHGNTKHGHSGKSPSPTYISWTQMKQRCTNPKFHDYKKYGAVGIGFCKEWESFSAFLADMGERPEGKSLDRIDNSLGYTKENCRWATPKEQTDNRSMLRTNTSGYSGVSLYKNGRYRARVWVDGTRKHLGFFETADAAAAAMSEYSR